MSCKYKKDVLVKRLVNAIINGINGNHVIAVTNVINASVIVQMDGNGLNSQLVEIETKMMCMKF
ncbi:hypothetical protein Q5M85_14385 [Paraclostridium bifermentans]|nr:hypothetical protein [Paraclostridium bifermentans]